MISLSLKEIQEFSAGRGLKEEFFDLKINGVSTDTRQIKKGNLFIPLVGDNFDGHDFIDSAIKAGASCIMAMDDRLGKLDESLPVILVEDTLLGLQNLAHNYLEEINPKVISVSGSNGKTATKDILESILRTQYRTHKTEGNFNNHIGLPLTILDMAPDTEVLVLEMGISDFKEMDRLSKIANPNMGILTNATEAHLDDLGTRDNVARAKMEFIPNMKPNGTYLYCYDDTALRSNSESLKGDFKKMSYGMDQASDFVIKDIEISSKGCDFKISSFQSSFFIPLIGKHQVLNGSAAIITAREFGVSEENIVKGLTNVKLTGMRNELKTKGGLTILDDSYKSNPSSLKSALDTMYLLKGYKRKILLVGDMLGIGDEIEFMHRDIGKIVDENEIDYIIGIGYYSEYIIWEAEERFGRDRLFHFEEKTDEVLELLKKLIVDDTLVLVKASRPLELDTIVRDLLED